MSEFIDNFHFIRPEWFYALIPAVLLFIWLFFKKQPSENWSKFCDQELLEIFLVQNSKAASRYPLLLILAAWLIAVLSIAGPSWEKVKSPLYTDQDALIIILDMSLSMNAADLKPSRIERAKHKITDIIKLRKEGQTALMVYAGDAHIVSPLTADNKTILSFIPVLDSSLMPVPGSNLSKALEKAESLFKNSGIKKGNILLLSDGIENSQFQHIKTTIQKLKTSGYVLSIIGTGTEDGAPIKDANGGFIKDSKGNIVLSKLDNIQLQQLANTGGGNYNKMTITDQDIKKVLSKRKDNFKKDPLDKDSKTDQTSHQQWLDQGALFVFLILPLALLLFRKGWIICLLIFILPYPYQPAYSMQWDDLWLRSDQQASKSFASGQHEKAAEQFSDPLWKGSAFYKAGKYQQAIEQFSKHNSLEANYNTANSLAQLKRFDEALAAYNKVLEKDPDHQDSLKNKKIVQDIIDKQKKQQQNNKNKNSDNQQDKDNKDQQQKSDQEQSSDNKNNQQSGDQQKEQQKEQHNDQQNKQQDKQQDKQQQENEQQNQQQKKAEQEALKKQKEKQKEKQQENKSLAEKQKDDNDKDKNKQEEKDRQSLYSQLTEEEQQSMDQYLQQINDDPAYLLRRKFYLNSTRSKQQNNNNQAQQPW